MLMASTIHRLRVCFEAGVLAIGLPFSTGQLCGRMHPVLAQCNTYNCAFAGQAPEREEDRKPAVL